MYLNPLQTLIMDMFTRQPIEPKWETSNSINMNIDNCMRDIVYLIKENIDEISEQLTLHGVTIDTQTENAFIDTLPDKIKVFFAPFLTALREQNPTPEEVGDDRENPNQPNLEARMRRVYSRLERRRNEYRWVLPPPDDGRTSAPHDREPPVDERDPRRRRPLGPGQLGQLRSIWPAIEILTRIAEHLRI
jgi:hypothetical protein